MNTKGRKEVLIYRLHTLKDKPSKVNKETKISSKYDVKIHRVNWLKSAILRLKQNMHIKILESENIIGGSIYKVKSTYITEKEMEEIK